MFVDDDATHVADVGTLPGATTLLVPPPQRGVGGIQAEQMETIRRWAGKAPGRLFAQPQEARAASSGDRAQPPAGGSICACFRCFR